MADKPSWRPPTWDESQERSLKRHIQDAERFRWLYPDVVSPSSPPRRIGHTAVYDRSCLYVFGGSDNTSKVGDVFSVNLQRKSWTSLATTGYQPRPVDGHASFFADGKIFVFGGTKVRSGGFLQKSNGFSYLDVDTALWVKPKVLGVLPPPRDCHSATFVPHHAKMVLFGGKGAFPEQRHLRDVHVLDLTTWTWSCPPVTGDLPRARENHGAVIVGDRLFILGGDAGDSNFVSELSVLDVTTYVWSKFEVVGRHPPPRAGHSCFARDDRIYVFGGLGNGGVLYNDLWVLYTRFSVWTKLDVSGPVPSGRFLHSTSFLAGQSAVIFYGGGGSSQGIAEIIVLDVLESDETTRAAAILASQEPGKLYSCSCSGCTPADVSCSKLHVEASDGVERSTGSHEESVLCLEAPLSNGDQQQLDAAYPAPISPSLQTSRTSVISEKVKIEIGSGCKQGSAGASAKRQRVMEDRSSIRRIFALQDNDYESRTTGDIMEAARRVLVENFALKNLENFRQTRSLVLMDNKPNMRQSYEVGNSQANWRTVQNISTFRELDLTASRLRKETNHSRMGSFRTNALLRSDQSSLNSPAQSPDRAAHEDSAYKEHHVHTRVPMAGPVLQANVVGVVENGYVLNAVIDGKLFAGVIGLHNANFAPPGWNEAIVTQQSSTEVSPVPRARVKDASSIHSIFQRDVPANVTSLPKSDQTYCFSYSPVEPHSGFTTSHRSDQCGRQQSPIPTQSSAPAFVDLTEECGSTPGQSGQPLTPLLLTSSLPSVKTTVTLGTLSNAASASSGPSPGMIQHRPTRQVKRAHAFNQAHHLQCATGVSPSILGGSHVRAGRFQTFLPPKYMEAPAESSCTLGGATSDEQIAVGAAPDSQPPGGTGPSCDPNVFLTLGLPGQGQQR